jgi:hypothetical protein
LLPSGAFCETEERGEDKSKPEYKKKKRNKSLKGNVGWCLKRCTTSGPGLWRHITGCYASDRNGLDLESDS